MEVYFAVRQNGRLLDISREELEEDIELIIVRSNSSLSITAKDKRRSYDWKRSKSVSIYVLAPKETRCDLLTSDGNIDIARLDGDQKLKTSDGNIQTSDIGGEVYAKTSDGNIVLDGIDDSAEALNERWQHSR